MSSSVVRCAAADFASFGLLGAAFLAAGAGCTLASAACRRFEDGKCADCDAALAAVAFVGAFCDAARRRGAAAVVRKAPSTPIQWSSVSDALGARDGVFSC